MPIDVYVKLRTGELERRLHGQDPDQYEEVVVAEHRERPDGSIQQTPHLFPVRGCWGRDETDQAFRDLMERAQTQRRVYWINFGYTGSGKTFTTLHLIRALFGFHPNQQPTVQAYQIDDTKVQDVLNQNAPVRYHKTDRLEMPDLSRHVARSADDLLRVIAQNRITQQTVLNSTSSRTHLILEMTFGKLTYCLADLAGQEHGQTVAQNGQVLAQQATRINQSLLALKECIRARNQGLRHVPFRRCVLTMALKPMFRKTAHTALIGTVNPHQVQQTLDTLRYVSALFRHEVQPAHQTAEETLFRQYCAESQQLLAEEQELLRLLAEPNQLGQAQDRAQMMQGLIWRRQEMAERYCGLLARHRRMGGSVRSARSAWSGRRPGSAPAGIRSGFEMSV